MSAIRLRLAFDIILQMVMNRTKRNGFSGIHGAGSAHLYHSCDLFPVSQINAIQNLLPCGCCLSAIVNISDAVLSQQAGDPVIHPILFE